MDPKTLRDLADPVKGPSTYLKIQKRWELSEQIWWAMERILAPAKYGLQYGPIQQKTKVRGA